MIRGNILIRGTTAVVVLKYLEFIEAFAAVSKDAPVRVRCIMCKTENSMVIPNF
jgi:hypothetical protein